MQKKLAKPIVRVPYDLASKPDLATRYSHLMDQLAELVSRAPLGGYGDADDIVRFVQNPSETAPHSVRQALGALGGDPAVLDRHARAVTRTAGDLAAGVLTVGAVPIADMALKSYANGRDQGDSTSEAMLKGGITAVTGVIAPPIARAAAPFITRVLGATVSAAVERVAGAELAAVAEGPIVSSVETAVPPAIKLGVNRLGSGINRTLGRTREKGPDKDAQPEVNPTPGAMPEPAAVVVTMPYLSRDSAGSAPKKPGILGQMPAPVRRGVITVPAMPVDMDM